MFIFDKNYKMESKKIKEMKDDVILDIKVNKSFYLMSKAALMTILMDIKDDSEKDFEKFIKSVVSKEYKDMSDKEKAFYTLTLLVGEIEKQAIEKNAYDEKEIDISKLKQDVKKSNED